MGYDVAGIAAEPALAGLRAGRAPVHEPGLDELLDRMLKVGRLRFTQSFAEGLRGADFAFLSIDTPVGADDESDLEPIWSAVNEVAAAAPDGLTVIVKPLGFQSARLNRSLGDSAAASRSHTSLSFFG